jgi:pimeloyl-ACP methyl ester carboxylesterase
VRVEEHTILLAGEPVFYRTASDEREGGVPAVPVIYLHGAPTSSEDWQPLLERTGGIAPDLFGFGRSAKGAHLGNTPEALADWVEDLLSALDIDRYKLVSHGWGTAAGVLLAARRPERVERLVLFNSVPLLENLTWPWWARLYKTRGVGEVAIGATTRGVLRRWLRQGSVRTDVLPSLWVRWWRWFRRPAGLPAPPPNRVAQIWNQFDQGTQRAVLRLVRSIDDERMQAMQAALQSLHMPTMLVWGERDPWWDDAVLDAYTARLPGARIERIPGAGHWPWLDDPAIVELTAGFLEDPSSD